MSQMQTYDEFWHALPEPYQVEFDPTLELHRRTVNVRRGLLANHDAQNVMNHFQQCVAVDRLKKSPTLESVELFDLVRMVVTGGGDWDRSLQLILMVLTDAAGGEESGEVPSGVRMIQHGEGSGRIPAEDEEGMRPYGLPADGSHSRTWELFLNGVERGGRYRAFEGGELYFPSREVVVVPSTGTLIMWWPGLPFGVAPVTGGVRRSLRGWCSFNAAKDIRLGVEHVLTREIDDEVTDPQVD